MFGDVQRADHLSGYHRPVDDQGQHGLLLVQPLPPGTGHRRAAHQGAKASYLATGAPIAFEQTDNRLVLKGLPDENPDKIAGVCVLKIEFDAPPRQKLGAGCVVL